MSRPVHRASELDLLRFCAAMAVVLYHYVYKFAAFTSLDEAYPLLQVAAQYGYLGVDLFFLISGFVIMQSANHGTLAAFIASRAARIYPTFWLCCTVTFIVLATAGDWRGFGTYLANLSLVGIFAAPAIDGAYWTLLWEIRFYFLVAVVIALGQLHRMELLLLMWLLVATALIAHPVRYLSALALADYAAYFIGGSMLYFVWTKGLTARRAAVIAICVVLAVYRSVDRALQLQTRDGVHFDPVIVGLIVVASFAFVLAVALRWTGILGRRSWEKVGALTYPLYLLHTAIGLTILTALSPVLSPHVLLWGLIALMVFAAWLVNVRFERQVSPRFRAWVEATLDRRWWPVGAAGR